MENSRFYQRLRKILSFLLCFCLFFEQTGFAQVLPSPIATPLASAPLLRYLSVNQANPFNYFNFLLDKGDTSEVAEGLLGGGSGSLNSQAKKLINYFFLGITLPDKAFWVNLRPDSPDKITSEELAKTDLGRVLLEQDLKLKKDVSKYLHPNHPQGKQYWERLYSTIGKDKAKKAKITTSNRVWIVPEEATVLETEDGALVVSAKLKVLLENEYFSSKQGLSPQLSNTNETQGTVPKSQEENIQLLSENLMKEIVLPAITQDINTSSTYAPLRQIYHSLILAEWFKRRIKSQEQRAKSKEQIASPYAFCIDKGYTQGLESEEPWEKDTFYQQYLKSYSQGEYKLEANLFGLRRMYWSGGVLLGMDRELNPEFKMTIRPLSSSPLGEKEGIYKVFKNGIPGEIINSGVMEEGKLSTGELNLHIPIGIENEGAPSPDDDGLSAEESQPTAGASEKEIAPSAAEKKEETPSASPITSAGLREVLRNLSLDIVKDLSNIPDEVIERFVKIVNDNQVIFSVDNNLRMTSPGQEVPVGFPIQVKTTAIFDVQRGNLITGIKKAEVFLNNNYAGPDRRPKLLSIFHELLETDFIRRVIAETKELRHSDLETLFMFTELMTTKTELDYVQYFSYPADLKKALQEGTVLVCIESLDKARDILNLLRNTSFEKEYQKDLSILGKFKGDLKDESNLRRQLPSLIKRFFPRQKTQASEVVNISILQSWASWKDGREKFPFLSDGALKALFALRDSLLAASSFEELEKIVLGIKGIGKSNWERMKKEFISSQKSAGSPDQSASSPAKEEGESILDKKLSRRNFLRWLGMTALTLTGVGGLQENTSALTLEEEEDFSWRSPFAEREIIYQLPLEVRELYIRGEKRKATRVLLKMIKEGKIRAYTKTTTTRTFWGKEEYYIIPVIIPAEHWWYSWGSPGYAPKIYKLGFGRYFIFVDERDLGDKDLNAEIEEHIEFYKNLYHYSKVLVAALGGLSYLIYKLVYSKNFGTSFKLGKPWPKYINYKGLTLASQSFILALSYLHFISKNNPLLLEDRQIQELINFLKDIDTKSKDNPTLGAEFHQIIPPQLIPEANRKARLVNDLAFFIPKGHGIGVSGFPERKNLLDLRIMPGQWPVLLMLMRAWERLGLLTSVDPQQPDIYYHISILGDYLKEAPWIIMGALFLDISTWLQIASVKLTPQKSDLAFGQAYTYGGVTRNAYTGEGDPRGQTNIFAFRTHSVVNIFDKEKNQIITFTNPIYQKYIRYIGLISLALSNPKLQPYWHEFKDRLKKWLNKEVGFTEEEIEEIEKSQIVSDGGGHKTTNPKLAEILEKLRTRLIQKEARLLIKEQLIKQWGNMIENITDLDNLIEQELTTRSIIEWAQILDSHRLKDYEEFTSTQQAGDLMNIGSLCFALEELESIWKETTKKIEEAYYSKEEIELINKFISFDFKKGEVSINQSSGESAAGSPLEKKYQSASSAMETDSTIEFYQSLIDGITKVEPAVITFGETHSSKEMSLLERFSEEILPELVKLGYEDLVVEHLINGIPQEEWDYVKAKRKIDPKFSPTLYQNINIVQDRRGLIKLIERAIDLEVNLYGCGDLNMSKSQIIEDMLKITNNAKSHIERLLTEKKKVISYIGSIHNEIKVREYHLEGRLTFGKYFFEKLQDKYLVIQLIDPNLEIKLFGSEDPLAKILEQTRVGKYKIIKGDPDEQNTLYALYAKKPVEITNYILKVKTSTGNIETLGYSWLRKNIHEELTLEEAAILKVGDELIFYVTNLNDKEYFEKKGLIGGKKYKIEEIEVVYSTLSSLPMVEQKESVSSPIIQNDQSVSSAITTDRDSPGVSGQSLTETGGIDLSQIELTLKDEKFISSLNPAERKILLAGKYLKEGWYSLCLLYVHETMLLFKDNLIKDIQNRDLLSGILNQLKLKDFLDPQALQFFQFIQSQKPLSEIKLAIAGGNLS